MNNYTIKHISAKINLLISYNRCNYMYKLYNQILIHIIRYFGTCIKNDILIT